jgi:predicted enzyme related to lactoylglutathione lyase
MEDSVLNRIVHLELRTGNVAHACSFLESLFGWRTELVQTGAGSYCSLVLGDRLDGGVVEHDAGRAFWLPYVEVTNVVEATRRARVLGASVCLPPREGPVGWRSVLLLPTGGMLALWEAK